MRIKLSVTELNLPSGDILQMYDGVNCTDRDFMDQAFGELVGTVDSAQPEEIIAPTGKMCLILSSSVGGGLYKIFWSEFPTCGGMLTGPSGDVISPGYPYNNYPTNKTCKWEIIVPKGQLIRLTVKTLDIKQSTGCTEDRLEIKGLSEEEVICDRVNRKSPISYTSTNNTAELLFISISRFIPRTAEGFWIKYKAVGCLPFDDKFGSPIESTYYHVGEKFRFKCPERQIYQSGLREKVRLCQDDNQWQSWNDTCVDITCAPPTITPGVIHQPVLEVYTIDSQVVFSCDDGLSLVGSRAIVCTVIGDWNTSTPTCPAKLSCPILSEPHNGRLLSVDTEIGGHAEYTCDIGYKLEGTDKITCQLNGVWDSAPPLCAPISTPGYTSQTKTNPATSEPIHTSHESDTTITYSTFTNLENITQINGGNPATDAKLQASKSDNTGRDIGIGIGVLVIIMMVMTMLYFIVQRRRASRGPGKSDETYENPTYNIVNNQEADSSVEI